jgi:uncharacterized protein with ParB-like and HNH nuclease domain
MIMDAHKKNFIDFLDGSDKTFVIPVYQRNYDWKKEHCRQLWNDLLDVFRQNRKSHFFGSIVSLGFVDENDDRQLVIIDGQQRITTITLLLLAMVHMESESLEKDGSISIDDIWNKYLIKEDKTRLKLKPVKNDSDALNKLYANKPNEYYAKSNVTANYLFFKDCLQKLPNDVHYSNILESIKKLEIVSMMLSKNEDNPQLIFESLNSTGLDLTEADKVRNYILMQLDSKTQELFYENYWNKIEILTSYNVSAFLRDFFIYKERRAPNINKVYSVFKEYMQKNPWKLPGDTEKKEAFLKELLLYASYYQDIIHSSHRDNEISKYLQYINNLEVTVVYPFLLELFYLNDETVNDHIVSDSDLLAILKIIEIFIIRRLICDTKTSVLNKLFMTLGREIQAYPSYPEEYLNILKFVLLEKVANLRFPSDDELREKMKTKDFYNLRPKNRIHIFQRLIDYEHREIVDIKKLLSERRFTFEHIMPQRINTNREWQDELGHNYALIHRTYLHTIGNLTFTAYNSEMSNKSFSEKKAMKGGFAETRLLFNDFIVEQERWDEQAIKKRTEMLIEDALIVWPYISATVPVKQKSKGVSYTIGLDDDVDVTGFEIQAFSLSGRQKILVNTWVDFYEQITEKVYTTEREKFRELLGANDLVPGVIGSDIDAKNNLKRTLRIDGDVYLEKNFTPKEIVQNVLTMFTKLTINSDKIKLYVKDK